MKIIFPFLWIVLFLCPAAAQTVASGNEEIDAMREEVARRPTTPATAKQRLAILSSWQRLLLHQGIDLSRLDPVLDRIGNFRNPQPGAIDEGYRLLDRIQADPPRHRTLTGPPERSPRPARPADWGLFHGGQDQAGYTAEAGPSQGKLAWRFPIGHAWYARPAVDDGRVYVASPGLVTIAYCLEERTGKVIWKARQFGISTYNEARVSSSVAVLGDTVVVRESGSGGEVRNAVDLVYLEKSTGKIRKEVRAGHVDYRRGYAPLTTDGRWLALARGFQSIQNRPPLVWMLNTVVLKNAESGENLWEYRTGDIFGDPVVAGNEVVVATAGGLLLSLNILGQERIRWTANLKALASTPEVTAESIIAAANNGAVQAFDRNTGAARWNFQVASREDRAFQFFSPPRVADGKVFIGAADRNLYCLDLASGKLLWKAALSDWVRSRPAVISNSVFAATMDGRLHAFTLDGRRKWDAASTTHQVLADLVATPRGVLVSSNDLMLSSFSPETGALQWRHGLLESARIGGERFEADVISGGADYQSPPAAAGGLVYVGSPNRFVYAIQAQSGKEVWRFETSGQISGQPIVAGGRVYFGQQGGDKDFYCVDAKTGRPIWRKPLGWAWVSAGFRDGTLYVGTVEGDIHAVRALDGTVLWTHQTNGGVYPSPATSADSVFSGSWDGHYFALDRLTGIPRWAYFLGGSPDSAAPILFNGKLYIQALSRYLDAIDARTGKSVWKFDVPAGFNINATPAAADGKVFFSIYRTANHSPSGARLFAADDRTGKILWEHAPGGGLTGASIARDRLYFASTCDVFFTCLRTNGELLWRYRLGGTVEESCPALYGGRVYILSADRHLYAFE